MVVLVLNCGSSSIKCQLVETSLGQIASASDRVLARGLVEKIGSPAAIVSFEREGSPRIKDAAEITDIGGAVAHFITLVTQGSNPVIDSIAAIGAVGHRITHGGELFDRSTLIDEVVAEAIVDLVDLAPLHNPANLKGYQHAKRLLPNVPHAAVFDTSYHQTMPQEAYLYALPWHYYAKGRVRRYGFHGTSHRFMLYRLRWLLNVGREGVNAVSCHLGNGCSLCAIRGGKSIDTTMGFTPLEGLVMGTRCGSIDPAVVLHLMATEHLDLRETTTMLNKHSGLLGLSGVSNDMRDILREADAGNARAQAARDVFVYRVAQGIASYAAMVGPELGAIAFTAGVGENSPEIRRRVCERLGIFGIELDQDANEAALGREALISTGASKIRVYVIPTNEELVIARDTVRCIEGIIAPYTA